ATASLEPFSPPAGNDRKPQLTVGPSAFFVTRTAAAAGASEATSPSNSDIAGESALSDARDGGDHSRGGRAPYWRVPLAIAAVGGAVVVVVQRTARRDRPAAPVPATIVAPAALTPAPAAIAPAAPAEPVRAAPAAAAAKTDAPTPPPR